LPCPSFSADRQAADENTPVCFILSSGNAHDAPEGRIPMETLGKQHTLKPLVMNRTYEDDLTQYTARTLKFIPIVPPKKAV